MHVLELESLWYPRFPSSKQLSHHGMSLFATAQCDDFAYSGARILKPLPEVTVYRQLCHAPVS